MISISQLSENQLDLLNNSDAKTRVQNNWPVLHSSTYERVLNVKQNGVTQFTIKFDEAKEYFQ